MAATLTVRVYVACVIAVIVVWRVHGRVMRNVGSGARRSTKTHGYDDQ
jgi:hypothetical protein